MVLIPKNDAGKAGNLAKLRPIAVASILYRGLMWIITKRMGKLADETIGWSQRGFRLGGSCHDVAEIVDRVLWTHQTTTQPFCLVQVDQGKAYDLI